jgi:O-antigen/teichoic acid export membrane protein
VSEDAQRALTDKDAATSNSSNRKLALGALTSGGVNFLKVGLQLLLLPIMARLLGPDEFGIYALALPTISIVSLLAEGGLGATLAREPETSSLVWSSAFWFLLATGFVLAMSASGFGFLLAYLVAKPRIAWMIVWLSFSLVFLVLSVPPSARLSRRKNLGAGAAAELAGSLAGAIVAIGLALHGAGAWSLVAQYLTTYGIRAIVLNYSAFERPQFVFSLASIRSHIASGGLVVGLRFSDYVGRIGENVLVDRIFGSSLMGSFTFANQVARFSTESVSNVSWSVLYVQALTSDRTATINLHSQLCRLLASVLFPITFLGVAAAPELILDLLGPRWSDLTLLLRIFLPASALSVVGAQVGPILLVIDRFGVYFWCAVGLGVARILAIGSGWWLGIPGTALGIGGATLLHFVVLIAIAAASVELPIIRMLRGLIGPGISSLAAAGLCRLLLDMFPIERWSLPLALTGGVAAFLICMIAIDRKGLVGDLAIIRRLVSVPKFST